jgi:hypothetical protein
MICRENLGWAAGFLLAVAPTGAVAQGWADAIAVEPPSWMLGNSELRLTGFAYGAGFTSSMSTPAGDDTDSGVTGQARANLRLQRITDSGLIYGAEAGALLLRDELSGDNYGNRTVEKLFLYTQTGLGRIEIGQQDGVGYTLGFTGPVVDDHISLENPDSTFFRDPATGHPFNNFSQDVTKSFSSSNAAKVNYLTPRLFGAQIGASFTPQLVKAPLPGLGNAPNGPDVQGSLWEVAGSYTTRLSDIAVGLSAGFTRGALRNPTPAHGDLYDLALGLQFAADISDVRLSWGGAYRVSNGYGFSPMSAFDDAQTRRLQLSAMAELGPWRAGGEFADGEMDAPAGTPKLNMQAYQFAAGYRPNDNLHLSAGWQWYDYDRNLGLFGNGARSIDMNAGFVTLGYSL